MMRHRPAYLSHTARRTEPPLRKSEADRSKGITYPPGGPFAVSGVRFVGEHDFTSLGSVATAFIDLDRTLLRKASGPALNRALQDEGVIPQGRSLPGDSLLYAIFDRFGENAISMALARAAARVAKGWEADQVRRAGRRAVPELLEILAPFAPQRLAAFREAGHRLVLATTTPRDMVEGLAEALGLDDVIATRYATEGGRYTGKVDGNFVWGLGKLRAVEEWAAAHDEDLDDCIACSDSVFDLPLLNRVGSPHQVNPDPRLRIAAAARRWPVEHWDRPDGVPSILGLEPFHILRHLVVPEMFPYARFDIDGIENVPSRGPVIVASNHRSYFDVAALALIAARLGRPVRALAKRELFALPVLSQAARAIGGIAVDRDRHPERAFAEAVASLEAGEVLFILPQGTIPRGRAFFDPVLDAKTGTARLAALTDAPVIPVGLWGTEVVWPRSSKVPNVSQVLDPPTVTVHIGHPVALSRHDAHDDTIRIMAAISELLPAASREVREPTDDELRSTFPSGRLPDEEG